MAAGIRQRHGRRCSRTGRCECPWIAEVYSKSDTAKIRKQFPTRAAAVAWRDDSRSAVRRGVMKVPTGATFKEAAEAWLENARSGLIRTRGGEDYKPATLRSYDQTLKLRIFDEMGEKRLSEITRNDLQDLVDSLVADGLSASTVTTALLPVRAIYRRSLARGEVSINPTAGVEMPAVRGGRDRIAAPAECQKLLTTLKADRALWATAMYAGLRCGELMALKVQDIDLGAGVIHVRRGWDRKEGEVPTKNRRERKVPIAAVLRDHLDEHILSLGWGEGHVFGPSPTRPFVYTSTMNRTKKAWDDAKLDRLGLHEARHTFASLMIAAGVNAKALSEYMGHATISITLDRYGHLMPGNESEAAGLLDAYLARAASDLVPVSCQSCTDSTGFDRTPSESHPHG